MHLAGLLQTVRSRRWLLGSLNVDEDLHYSSYFLTAATDNRLNPFAYSILVSWYKGRDEYYIVDADESAECSTRMQASVQDPDFVTDLTSRILDRARKLDSLNSKWSERNFQSLDDIGTFLGAHDSALRKLYQVARQPEVLDRGHPYYTNALRTHLRSWDLSSDDYVRWWRSLTKPDRGSAITAANSEYRRILTAARSRLSSREMQLLHERPGLAHQFLPGTVVQQLHTYASEWCYLRYHGYVRRSIPTLDDILPEFCAELSAGENSAEAEERLLIDVPDSLVAEFRPFREFSSAKLQRRLAQLRMFPVLDRALACLAVAFDIPEVWLRFALPSELTSAIERGLPESDMKDRWMERSRGCVVVWQDGLPSFTYGRDAVSLCDSIVDDDALLGRPDSDVRVLHGEGISGDTISGIAVVVDRYRDEFRGLIDQLPQPHIIVSESTELDFLHLIQRAGGLVTVRGGVTSHAAVIARELGIVSVLGVGPNARRIRTGDYLELNGSTGTVVRRQTAVNR